MLKRMLGAMSALALVALPLAAQGSMGGKDMGSEVTLTGTVVDVNCYTANGATGAAHKACAEACAKAGVPLGILSSDGTLYMAVSAKPADPQNSKLLPFAEGKVKVTGTHRFKNGLHSIEIKTIEAAT